MDRIRLRIHLLRERSILPRGLLWMLVAAAPLGCSKAIERSDMAVALPAVNHDVRENTSGAENWPGWRGVNASGISSAERLPIEWTTTKGIHWKQPVPGRGNSSPVVWENQVLVTSSLGEEAGSSLKVYSFDRRTGAPQWQADAGKGAGSKHPKNSYASASVTTDGHSVFAAFGGAGLFAFDLATGHPLWHAELGLMEHQWGTASSPVLAGDLVIQLCDSANDSQLRAFEKTTGRPVWQTARNSNGSWSTPVLIETTADGQQSRQELIVNGTGPTGAGRGSVIAYNPQDGHELWQVQGTTEVVCPTAIVGGGLIVSTSGRNGPIIAIKPGGDGDVTHTNVVWKHLSGGAYIPTGVAYRNRLFTLADGGALGCFNLGNGDEVWRDRLKGTFTASLVAGDGRIYAANEEGVVYVFAAADTFQLLATNDMGEGILATPALVGDQIFLRTEKQLYCISGQSDVADVQANPSRK